MRKEKDVNLKLKISQTYLISLLLIVGSSCNNQQNEDRIKRLEAQILKLESNKSNSIKKQEKVKTGESIISEERIRKQSDMSVYKKFVGAWKYYKSIPAAHDNSMQGIICQLERYENTNKTFVFHLWDGHDLILSVKDENTLIGQNANLTVKYDPRTDHLTLVLSSDSKEVYSRLQ